jgi:PAS domain S-box-containing protein
MSNAMSSRPSIDDIQDEDFMCLDHESLRLDFLTHRKPRQGFPPVREFKDDTAAEERLTVSQKNTQAIELLYRTVLETSRDGVAISRLDNGTLIDGNQAFMDALGFKRDEVIGQSALELGAWMDPQIRRNLTDSLVEKSQLRDQTVPFRRKNGEALWVQLSASLVDLDGLACTVWVARDAAQAGTTERASRTIESDNRPTLTKGRMPTSGTIRPLEVCATGSCAPAQEAAFTKYKAMEEELSSAISKKEFEMYYQPQVNSSGLIGAEALIRWNRGNQVVLEAVEFLPLAEETGLILLLGMWVLETVCAQIAAWEKQIDGFALIVAVNVSPLQFWQPDFVEKVLAVLSRTEASPRNLKLEITETVLNDDIRGAITKVSALKAHGVKFSLDDCGHSDSLPAFLERVPFDELKMDRYLVQNLSLDDASEAVVESILSLSRLRGMSVIAKAVETDWHRDTLSRLGCQEYQGYLFAPPLPIAEFERTWLAMDK